MVAISSTSPGVNDSPVSEGTSPAPLATAAISMEALVPSRNEVCMLGFSCPESVSSLENSQFSQTLSGFIS
jgi:hypothetical protein